jgi:hypothetical protein
VSADLRLESVSITGAGGSFGGVWVTGGASASIKQCRISGNFQNGIFVEDGTYLTIDSSDIGHTGVSCVRASGRLLRVQIHHSRFHQVRDCIILDCDQMDIRNSHIWQCQNGITINGMNRLYAHDCIIEKNNYYGIRVCSEVKQPQHLILSKCALRENGHGQISDPRLRRKGILSTPDTMLDEDRKGFLGMSKW